MDTKQKPFFVHDRKVKNLVGAVSFAGSLVFDALRVREIAVYPAIEIPFITGEWGNLNFVAVGSIYCQGKNGGIKNFVELITIEKSLTYQEVYVSAENYVYRSEAVEEAIALLNEKLDNYKEVD